MQAIRSRDTRPEIAVRRLLHAAGYRYRVGVAPDNKIRRRADIVFPRMRIAIFIDGCFWHGCAEHGRRVFKQNAEYWSEKISSNMARDMNTNSRLKEAGWTVLRFWEHQDPSEVSQEIVELLSVKYNHPPEKI